MSSTNDPGGTRTRELARVLLVNDDIAARLTLQTVLEAGGYAVDVAASAAEAVGKLDEREYQLVLSGMRMESPEAGRQVLAHARIKEYQPATAVVTTYHGKGGSASGHRGGKRLTVETQDVASLLGKVADLIGVRASRRLARRKLAALT